MNPGPYRWVPSGLNSLDMGLTSSYNHLALDIAMSRAKNHLLEMDGVWRPKFGASNLGPYITVGKVIIIRNAQV